jgi:hypothetical protein
MIDNKQLRFYPQTVKEATETTDADFDIIDPKTAVFDIKRIEDRMKRIGALEDIDHEIIQPKQLI